MLACGWAVWVSGRTSLARLMVKYGATIGNATPLDAAIHLTPADAECHYTRAALSNYFGQHAEALGELELAVSLRPRDYALWLELGMTRDQLEDSGGALAALNESVRLAPYYSEPRWQRGNLLFRMSRYDEAFADLRGAAGSNPGLLPNLIDLAWGASGYNPELTEQILQAQTSGGHLGLALFFANHGQPGKAVANFALAKNVTVDKRRELVRTLSTAGDYAEAFAVWRQGVPTNITSPSKGTIFDGSFEGPLTFEDTGFGWRCERGSASLGLSSDPNLPHAGSRSLRIDFNGNSNPDSPIVTQLVPVEPATRYKLSFAVRTTNIVTGGPPKLMIKDATAGSAPMASSAPLQTSGSWQVLSLEFFTGAKIKAVLISLERERCASSPCPIFGSLNLDSVSLERGGEP
jgi:tetratricopeptide (TPR) repeat protein